MDSNRLSILRDDLAWALEETLSRIKTADFVSATREECLTELEWILRRMNQVSVYYLYVVDPPSFMDSHEVMEIKRQCHAAYVDFNLCERQIRLLYQEVRACHTDTVYVEGVLMELADELDKTYDWEE